MTMTINKILPAAVLFCVGSVASAQSISTSGQLKQACETSPGNVVNITLPTKIEFGPALPTPENVNSACTIVIGPNATFEVKQVAVTFAGALAIQSAEKTKLVFEDAPWTARSVTVSLTGTSSEMISKQSRLRATSGNVSVTTGPTGKLELINPFAPNPNGIEATGSISINAGDKFSGVIGDANLQAGSGITISLGGADSILKLDEANLKTTAGSVSVSAAGQKAIVEMNQGTYGAAAGVSVVLTNAESGLKVKDGIFNGGSGSITLQAGSSTAAFGNVEVSQSNFSTSSTISITSGTRGKASGDDLLLNGAQGVTVRSGNQGSTLVKNSRGTSNVSFTVATGVGGVCISNNNVFTAPVLSLCQ